MSPATPTLIGSIDVATEIANGTSIATTLDAVNSVADNDSIVDAAIAADAVRR